MVGGLATLQIQTIVLILASLACLGRRGEQQSLEEQAIHTSYLPTGEATFSEAVAAGLCTPSAVLTALLLSQQWAAAFAPPDLVAGRTVHRHDDAKQSCRNRAHLRMVATTARKKKSKRLQETHLDIIEQPTKKNGLKLQSQRHAEKRSERTAVQRQISLTSIDPHALTVVRRLNQFGHKAYLVGGCVRDLLLGLTPKDFDVSTDARPEEVKRIFKNSRIIGKRFQLVQIFRWNKDGSQNIIEVSTFRAMPQKTRSVDIPDSEHLIIHKNNKFGSEEEDAWQRDFTINGLFYNIEAGEIIDHVEGLKDIERRYLRVIGDPDIRICEDPVRMLRAIRFTAKLDVKMDEALKASIIRHREDLRLCNSGRISYERMNVLSTGYAARTWTLLEECGLQEILLPNIEDFCPVDDAAISEIDTQRSRSWLLAHLAALDTLVARGPISETVKLGSLLYAPLSMFIEDSANHMRDRRNCIREFLFEVHDVIGLTHKQEEELSQLFQMQQKLIRAGESYKGRGHDRALLMERRLFGDAVNLLEVHTRARNQPLDNIKEWHADYEESTGQRLVPSFSVGKKTFLAAPPVGRGAGKYPRKGGPGRGQGRK
mmetsp:Transcript_158652/g.304395  ORF Transcript_158652/g.304395 Transcript_158652/m.304395 type:complete len:599 (+) Transcript_158652:114-1910(+)